MDGDAAGGGGLEVLTDSGEASETGPDENEQGLTKCWEDVCPLEGRKSVHCICVKINLTLNCVTRSRLVENCKH